MTYRIYPSLLAASLAIISLPPLTGCGTIIGNGAKLPEDPDPTEGGSPSDKETKSPGENKSEDSPTTNGSAPANAEDSNHFLKLLIAPCGSFLMQKDLDRTAFILTETRQGKSQEFQFLPKGANQWHVLDSKNVLLFITTLSDNGSSSTLDIQLGNGTPIGKPDYTCGNATKSEHVTLDDETGTFTQHAVDLKAVGWQKTVLWYVTEPEAKGSSAAATNGAKFSPSLRRAIIRASDNIEATFQARLK